MTLAAAARISDAGMPINTVWSETPETNKDHCQSLRCGLQTHIERAQTAEAVAEDLQAEIKQLTADAEDVKGTQQAARSKMASLQVRPPCLCAA